jgi:hypothetical protein
VRAERGILPSGAHLVRPSFVLDLSQTGVPVSDYEP